MTAARVLGAPPAAARAGSGWGMRGPSLQIKQQSADAPVVSESGPSQRGWPSKGACFPAMLQQQAIAAAMQST